MFSFVSKRLVEPLATLDAGPSIQGSARGAAPRRQRSPSATSLAILDGSSVLQIGPRQKNYLYQYLYLWLYIFMPTHRYVCTHIHTYVIVSRKSTAIIIVAITAIVTATITRIIISREREREREKELAKKDGAWNDHL